MMSRSFSGSRVFLHFTLRFTIVALLLLGGAIVVSLPAFGQLADAADAVPAPALPADCTPAQCQAMGTAACGTAAPYACLSNKGCYNTGNVSTCPGTACNFDSCPNSPGFVAPDQRSSRTVTFDNQCTEDIEIYYTAAGVGAKPTPLFTVDASKSKSYTVQLTKGTNSVSGKTFYEMTGGNGVNFGAYPGGGDVADMTLFEINMGGNQGQADWYDLSAIPPGSCASHMNSAVTNYAQGLGYADHLPFKNINDSSQNWDCLQDGAGNPIPGTCGDGLGGSLCPQVTGSVQAMKAEKGVNRGWGVTGEKCCGPLQPGQKAGVDCPTPPAGETCVPWVCAMADGDDPTSNTVRQAVYECATNQSIAVNGQPSTAAPGFSYPLKVEATWSGSAPPFASSCEVRSCTTGDGTVPTAADCDAYLWPYDDEVATVICYATPDYKVTLCP
ncbi:MAG: hypothetical protein AAGD01_05265 [Acidobacteriota bacterium]